MRPRFIALGLAAVLLTGADTVLRAQDQAPAADADQTRLEIQALEREIQRIGREQRRREGERSKLQDGLRANELRLSEIARALASLRTEVAAGEAEIRRLATERKALQTKALAQQDAVAEEVRRAWQSSSEGQLKLLLNQEDPESVARLLAYYRYIVAARNDLLAAYRQTLAELTAVEDAQLRAQRQLEAQRESLAATQATLLDTQQQRQELLVAIVAELASGDAELAAREKDREQLEVLLADIEAALARITTREDVEPFSSTRGLMPWPVDGRITHRFGNPRNRGKMRWRGVRLRAEAGSSVAAIHHGRVVYADWLRGSGLLLVIDHGEGYMSLYAHNESLLREVGDWVSTGEAISTVGSSGGQTEAALYFEIRKNGQPTDPQKWCRG